VRISWRPRNAQATMALAAGLIMLSGGVLPGGPALAALATATATPTATATVPAGGPHRAARPQSAAGPMLTISVTDGRTAAHPGDKLTYLVRVRDGGTVRARHITITQTLSAGLELLSASPHAVAVGGRVTWPATIAAGGTQTFRVVARVTRTPARLLRLAAIACASADGSTRPIVCAAHLDRLPAAAAGPARRATGTPAATSPAATALPYAVGALVVLGASALVLLVRRRARLQRRLG
jgi:uncharacterized repeat protein (TIGR01451 family)